MKWSHATGLLVTLTTMAAGGVWAGCSSNDNGNDAGTDGGGSDVVQQKDTGTTDSGGNDSGGGDASDGGGIVVDASALDCNYYCTSIMAACTGTNQQYLDQATCVSMCSAGIPNDAGAGATSGDSLACRMYHLSVAATSTANAATHCPHAGPFGFGQCGSICQDFCQQFFTSNCSNDTLAYATRDACNTYCATAPGSDASAGDPGQAASSPAMACKEYHLENAIKTGGDGGGGHCGHAGAVSAGGVCPN
jgi:hypothetical protein